MHGIIPFLLRHGYWVLFLNVLAEQAALPIPAVPVLLAMGALAGLGHFSFTASLAVAVGTVLVCDLVWYRLGRVRGHSILNLLCRLSLEPDSCVSRTKGVFRRVGALALLFAKFFPGLNTAAPPMAGLTRMPPPKFLIADIAGATLWSATYLVIGYLFRNQLEYAADQAGRMGSWLLLVLVSLLAVYIGWKYYQAFHPRTACGAGHARRTDGDDANRRRSRGGRFAALARSGARQSQAAGRHLDRCG